MRLYFHVLAGVVLQKYKCWQAAASVASEIPALLSCLKAFSSMADMQAHRGLIYDSCHFGLVQQPRTSQASEQGSSVLHWE